MTSIVEYHQQVDEHLHAQTIECEFHSKGTWCNPVAYWRGDYTQDGTKRWGPGPKPEPIAGCTSCERRMTDAATEARAAYSREIDRARRSNRGVGL